jgi:alpha-ribazole phosphatase
MELLLVRHGEVAGELRGRCYGRLDVPLSDEGRAQARALAERLSSTDVAAVVSSPRVRARDTATSIARPHAVQVATLDQLCELDFGVFEGLTYEEIEATWPELYERWMTQPTAVEFPGGETFADLRARVADAVSGLRRSYEGRTVVAVTHAGVVRTVVATALGMPDDRIFDLSVDPASVTHVGWSEAGVVVRGLNVGGAAPRRGLAFRA